jgi:hypothetical protein
MAGMSGGLAALALAVVLGAGTCAERTTAPADAGVRPDGGGAGGGCTIASSAQRCAADEVCDVTGCATTATGVCVTRPTSCPDTGWTPVCTCDRSTWANDCLRLQGGHALNFVGECPYREDAGPSCLDSDLEPNDGPTAATDLDGTLAGHPQGVSLYGVEICGSWDVDYYSFTVSAAKHALVVIQFQRDQGEISASLLDPSLAVLATGTPVGAGLQLEADLQPQSGSYYLLVAAGPSGTINKYDFSLTFSSL